MSHYQFLLREDSMSANVTITSLTQLEEVWSLPKIMRYFADYEGPTQFLSTYLELIDIENLDIQNIPTDFRKYILQSHEHFLKLDTSFDITNESSYNGVNSNNKIGNLKRIKKNSIVYNPTRFGACLVDANEDGGFISKLYPQFKIMEVAQGILDVWYLLAVLSTPQFVDSINNGKYADDASGRTKMSFYNLIHTKIPLPEIEIQKTIGLRFKALVDEHKALAYKLENISTSIDAQDINEMLSRNKI